MHLTAGTSSSDAVHDHAATGLDSFAYFPSVGQGPDANCYAIRLEQGFACEMDQVAAWIPPKKWRKTA